MTTPIRFPQEGRSAAPADADSPPDAPPGPSAGGSLDRSARLSQAIASRICHDLVSPVGAVANGADLITTFGASADGQEIAMIGQSAERASALLTFFRLAFGAVPEEAMQIARSNLCQTVEGMLSQSRTPLTIEGADGPAIDRSAARLAALMALTARGLVRARVGVRLVLGLGDKDALPIAVSTMGAADPQRLAVLEAQLAGSDALPEPNQIEFALLRPAASAIGARLALAPVEGPVGAVEAGGVTLTARAP